MVEQAGRQAVLRPGDMTVYDSTRPYRVEKRERTELHYFRIPRDAGSLDASLVIRVQQYVEDHLPLGVRRPSHFGRVFKAASGVTPDEWRRSGGPHAPHDR